MAITLQQGTKEYILVDVEDELNAITSLDGKNPRFTVMDAADVAKYTDQAATNVNMKAYCLIDTMNGGAWAGGVYRLWLKIDATPEVPYIGPFEFDVEAP
jgi:hypothetical protein